MQPRVNKWLDLLDRVGWTAVQAAAGAIIAFALLDNEFTWEAFLTFVGVTTALTVCKVIVGQRTGGDETGSLIGTSVIEPPPKA